MKVAPNVGGTPSPRSERDHSAPTRGEALTAHRPPMSRDQTRRCGYNVVEYMFGGA